MDLECLDDYITLHYIIKLFIVAKVKKTARFTIGDDDDDARRRTFLY